MRLRFEAVVVLITCCVTADCVTTARAAEGSQPVSFVRDVRPILARTCFTCHGPDDSPGRPNEIATLAKLFDSRRAHYETHPDEALPFATNPLGPPPEGHSAADLAALTAVANVILNLDEFVTRN